MRTHVCSLPSSWLQAVAQWSVFVHLLPCLCSAVVLPHRWSAQLWRLRAATGAEERERGYWTSLQTMTHVNHSFPISRVSGICRRPQCRPYRRPSFVVFGVFDRLGIGELVPSPDVRSAGLARGRLNLKCSSVSTVGSLSSSRCT